MVEKFSFDTIKDFDEHINYSIPNYQVLNDAIVSLCDYFKDDNLAIYDIGCSTGRLLDIIEFKGEKIGIEISNNLIPVNNGNTTFLNIDLNKKYKFKKSCIIISVFTIVFLRKEARLELLSQIYEGLEKGGAFFFVEKVYHSTGQFQDLFTFSYYDFKKHHFSNDQILEKEKNLRVIQKPNTTSENYELLRKSGFEKISMFYKFYNFEGFLCIK